MRKHIWLVGAACLLASCANFLVGNVPPEKGNGDCPEYQNADAYAAAGFPIRCGPQEETPH